MPSGMDGRQDLGQVPQASQWHRVQSGPGGGQVRPSSAGSLVPAWRVSPTKGQELPSRGDLTSGSAFVLGPAEGCAGRQADRRMGLDSAQG